MQFSSPHGIKNTNYTTNYFITIRSIYMMSYSYGYNAVLIYKQLQGHTINANYDNYYRFIFIILSLLSIRI